MNHLLTSCVTGNHHYIQVQYVVIQCKYCAMCSWWTNADYCKVTFIGTSLHGVRICSDWANGSQCCYSIIAAYYYYYAILGMLCSVVQCSANIILTYVVLLLEPLHGYVIVSWFVLCLCSIVNCCWADRCDKCGAWATILPSGTACRTLQYVYDFCEVIRCNGCMYCYRIISVSSTSSLAFPQVNEALTQLQAVGPTLLEVHTVGFWW